MASPAGSVTRPVTVARNSWATRPALLPARQAKTAIQMTIARRSGVTADIAVVSVVNVHELCNCSKFVQAARARPTQLIQIGWTFQGVRDVIQPPANALQALSCES